MKTCFTIISLLIFINSSNFLHPSNQRNKTKHHIPRIRDTVPRLVILNAKIMPSDLTYDTPHTTKDHPKVYFMRYILHDLIAVQIVDRHDTDKEYFKNFNTATEAAGFIANQLNPPSSCICC